MNSQKNIFYTILFSSSISLFGSFLLISPFSKFNLYSLPDFACFIWVILILLGNLFLLYKIFKLRINFFTSLLLLSYIVVSFGFILNLKNHLINFIFLIFILIVLNINLITSVFGKYFLSRYFLVSLIFLESKIEGVLKFRKNFCFELKNYLKTKSDSIKIIPDWKIIKLFSLTGVPIILLVIILLQRANTGYLQWVTNYFFSFDFFQIFFFRLIFFIIALLYITSEIYFLFRIKELYKKIENSKINYSDEIQINWFKVGLVTMFLLNLFYLLFIVAELKYDFGSLSNLIIAKKFHSYSALAVSRFWELILVSFINLGIMYSLVGYFREQKLTNKILKNSFLINIFFLAINTFFLIFSSYRRLSFYIDFYGFTTRRLLSYCFLPVLLIILFLFCLSFFIKKYQKCFQISFGILILYFAIFIALPTGYIVNKINFERFKDNKIIKFDPYYSTNHDDGLMVAIDMLIYDDEQRKEKKDNEPQVLYDGMTFDQLKNLDQLPEIINVSISDSFSIPRMSLMEGINGFLRKNKDINWRDINLMRSWILNSL